MEQIRALINWLQNLSIVTFIDLGIAIAIILFFVLLRGPLAYLVVKIFKMKEKDKQKIKEVSFYKPLKIFFPILGIYLACIILRFDPAVFAVITKAFRICVILLAANGIASLFKGDSIIAKKIQKKLKSEDNENRLSFFFKIIRGAIYIIAGFIVVIELGYNINGLIAGLGLGGVIVTLAAQDTAKNLFGGFVLMIDKPFVVGDWIQTTNFEGNVEDITFRSTRVRTFENSVVNIPNSVLSNESIINWSKMEKRRYKLDLKLALDTPMETVQNIVSKIYFMLINHPNVINDDTYVKFDEIKEDGIDIMIYVFTNSIDYESYLNAKEHINHNIMEILEHENVKLAYPTSTVYVKQEKQESK